MEKSINDYDKNLEELERQRENLEMVMKMMGQEWEESGAGIGWLGSLDLLPELDSDKDIQSPIESSQHFTLSNAFSNTAATTEPLPEPSNTLTTTNNNTSFQPLLTNILSSNSGPSPEYLQSLLHVNEVLLAQSLANTGDDNTINKSQLNEDMIDPSTITPFLTPAIMDSTNINDISCDQYTNTPTSPLITPTFTNNDDTLPSIYKYTYITTYYTYIY